MDRRIISLHVALFTFILLYVAPVAALSFTANVTPAETNASDSDILVNFTISHTNTTANITQLNISLPSGFTYSGEISDDATTSDNSTGLDRDTTGGIIRWTNTSTLKSFVSGANRFWFEIDTPGSNATFSFNITMRDTEDIISTDNITFKLLDTIAPQFSSNTTSVSTSSKYVRNRTYEFSATWTDRISVQAVLIEHNFTGTSTNYTMDKTGSSIYKYNFTDLGGNHYVWRMYANDSVNNVNKTDQYVYNVSKADNALEIFFDGNRNQDYQTSNESSLNVTANSSAGTVFIFRNGNLVVSGSTPQSSVAALASGTYTFKTNATGNQNYSDNSTGLTYTVTLTGPAPKWSSNTTSLPSTYSNSTASTFEVTWSDNTDSNGFSATIIEINYTGSAVNYTMHRVPGTNKSSYNATLPAGAITWKVYGNNSNNVFNATPLWTADVPKAAPTLAITNALGFTVDVGATTNATCGANTNQVTVKMYRNGASVSIPDSATLAVGIYTYICNNTATQNYSAGSDTENLEIRSFPKYLSIVNISSALKLIEVTENSNKSVTLEVKNTGNLSDTVTFEIEGINSSWYTTNDTSAIIAPRGGIAAFKVTFAVGSVEIKDYEGKFVVTGADGTLTSDFTLKILPSEETKMKINDTLLLYKTEIAKFENEINDAKGKNLNVSTVEGKYTELTSKLGEAETSINEGDYFKASQVLDEIKSLLDSAREELSNAQEIKIDNLLEAVAEQPNIITYILIAGLVIVVGFLAYLFWPTKEKQESAGQKQETKQPIKAQASSAVNKITQKVASVKGGDLKNLASNFVQKVKEMNERKKKFKYQYKGDE